MEMFLQITIKSGLYLFFGHRQNMVQNGFPGVAVQSRSKRIAVVTPDVERVKECRKSQDFHFALQILPTLLNGTYLHCQMTGFIPIRVQNL